MKSARRHVAVVCVTLFWCFLTPSKAQNPCPAPPPVRGTAKGNIFSDQQEMDLGDAMAERSEQNFHVIQSEELNSYLSGIAQRLLAQMPPTQLKFRIVLVDLPVVNAFTMPGARVYVTRKLVAFVRSEDELAAVLGHELGHALTHQPAADTSKLFHEVLGVSKVSDRADIFLKYNQMIDNIARKRLQFNAEEDRQEQLVADSYGLYALTRAGYSPEAMADFWDRRAQTEGKTGNWLTDFFGGTTPSQQRLRQMRESIPSMPAACVAPRPTTAAFQSWQQSVIAYAAFAGQESLPGLVWQRQLSPPLESEISNVRFSPDGKYLLAQDDFSVYLLSREPLRDVFRIPVDDVQSATFTPDSQSVLIWTRFLHVEKWNVGSQTRTEVHEVVTPEACSQTDLSPDGTIAACIQMVFADSGLRFNLSLLDVATSTPVITKENFYQFVSQDVMALFFALISPERNSLFHMDFSPDGHYFAISRGYEELAWDLRTHSPVKLSSAVKNIMSGGFAFDNPDHIVGIDLFDPQKSGSAEFPSGPPGKPIAFYQQYFARPAHGEGILVRPAGNDAVALVDLKTAAGTLTSKIPALDVYDSFYARPKPDGSIGLFDLKSRQEIASTPLLGHWIGSLRTAAVSPDLNWFAASGNTRGALWRLADGSRIFHVRGFGSCGFSSQDSLYAGFNPYLKEKRSMGILSPVNNTIEPGIKLDEDVKVAQLGMYLLYTRRQERKWNSPLDLELRDLVTGTVLWTKHFSHEAPGISASSSTGEIALVLPLTSDEAKAEEKHNGALASESKAISSKNTASLIEVVNAQDGKLRAEFAVDTGNRSFAIHRVFPAGNWMVIEDDKNRALVYSLEGKLIGRAFGSRPAVSAGGTLALESQPGTLKIYSLDGVTERETLSFRVPLAFYQFVENGAELFAVTEDQVAYLLKLGKPNPETIANNVPTKGQVPD